MLNTNISTITLRHFNQYAFSNKLKSISINEIQGTSLLDMCVIYTNKLNFVLIENDFKKISKSKNSYRDKIGVYHHKSKKYLGIPLEIVIERDSEDKLFSKLKNYTLRINPSRFKNFQDFLYWVNELVADESYVLGRVDATVLLPKIYFPVEGLAKFIYIEKKQSSVFYYENYPKIHLGKSEHELMESGIMTGFEIGNYPDRLTIYDAERYILKERAKKNFYAAFYNKKFCRIPDYHKRFLNENGQRVSVVERQMHSALLKKMQIYKIEDLANLSVQDPFSHVEFMDWNLEQDEFFKRRNKERLFEFMLECSSRGYHHARSKYNKSNNFHRIQNIFTPVQVFKERIFLSEYIANVFKNGIDEYFNKNEMDTFKV